MFYFISNFSKANFPDYASRGSLHQIRSLGKGERTTSPPQSAFPIYPGEAGSSPVIAFSESSFLVTDIVLLHPLIQSLIVYSKYSGLPSSLGQTALSERHSGWTF